MKKLLLALSGVLKSNKARYAITIFALSVLGFIIGKKLLKYYGAKPSKKDKRDFRIATVAQAFPQSFELPLPVIKNQGSVGSCVAHSTSYLAEYQLPKTDDYSLDRVSVGWIYGYRPNGYYKGEGMYPRDAMKTVQKVGVLRHKDFPFNEEVPIIINRVNSNLSSLMSKANLNQIPTYFQLKTTEEIKTCLMKFGPVSVMFPVHAEFMAPVDGKIDVKGLKQFQGYHQVSIYGWVGDYWLIVNSWDVTWGNKGTALISMQYPWVEMWGMSKSPEAYVNPAQKKTLLTRFWEWMTRKNK